MMMCEKNLVQSEISNSKLYSLSVEDLAVKAGKYVDSLGMVSLILRIVKL